MEPIEQFKPNLNRRKAIAGLVAAGAVVCDPKTSLSDIIPHPEKQEAEKQLLKSNPNVSLVNLSMVPKEVFPHPNTEPILMSINFGKTFNSLRPEQLNCDIDIYGQGVREAIKRGQQVFLVIETPGKTSEGVNTESWQKYITALSQRWNGANLIIGNENNHYTDNPWNDPSVYADLYVEAAKIIRNLSPKTKILPYGEAHCGNGEILKETLQLILQKSKGIPLVDGLAFHYYGRSSSILERIQLYQQIANDYKLPSHLYLTELGKPESTTYSEELHSTILAQNLSLALSFVGKELEVAFWHTAFCDSKSDKGGHKLVWEDIFGFKHPYLAFNTFWEISRLLHHNVSFQKSKDGIYTVTGENSLNEVSTISWNPDPNITIAEQKPKIITRKAKDFLRS